MIVGRGGNLLDGLFSADLCEGSSNKFLSIVVYDCFRCAVALHKGLERWSCLSSAFSGVDEDKASMVV